MTVYSGVEYVLQNKQVFSMEQDKKEEKDGTQE